MIRSMTGFGKATGASSKNSITVEIRSLNSKFLELGVRLPQVYKDRELDLRGMVSKIAMRGKVDVNVVFEPAAGVRPSMVNRELVKAYLNDLKMIQKETGLKPADPIDVVLRFTNILNTEKSTANVKEWKLLESLVRKAMKDFNDFRVREGKALQKDIDSRIKKISATLKKIEKLDPIRIKNIKVRLRKNFDDVEDNIGVDRNRFEQELVYYLEKMDINEEKVRLKAHLSFLIETIASKDSGGKKIGFILQEIGREINTIGSKANNAKMQRMVVEMKDELEKMKEQTANII
jgi:uncharacterized protein (TIGR00255 family)